MGKLLSPSDAGAAEARRIPLFSQSALPSLVKSSVTTSRGARSRLSQSGSMQRFPHVVVRPSSQLRSIVKRENS